MSGYRPRRSCSRQELRAGTSETLWRKTCPTEPPWCKTPGAAPWGCKGLGWPRSAARRSPVLLSSRPSMKAEGTKQGWEGDWWGIAQPEQNTWVSLQATALLFGKNTFLTQTKSTFSLGHGSAMYFAMNL